MGLDQIAYSSETEELDWGNSDNDNHFYWRKHSKLQQFIEDEIYKEHGTLGCTEAQLWSKSLDDLNLRPIELNIATIAILQNSLISKGLPESEGRFYFGHQWQDERAAEYFKQDIKFCSWAIDQIRAGHKVFYRADW